jgi:Flp pilus assembly protein TadG
MRLHLRGFHCGAAPGAFELSPALSRLRLMALRIGLHCSNDLSACRRGSVAVEFAVASVPLMLIVFGFIATAALFNTWASMQGNAQYAARLMSTGQIKANNNGTLTLTNTTATVTCSSTLATTQVEYYACLGLPTWTTFTVTTTQNCTTPSVTVSLSTGATTAAIADVERIFAGKTIVAQSVMMKEGTCPSP